VSALGWTPRAATTAATTASTSTTAIALGTSAGGAYLISSSTAGHLKVGASDVDAASATDVYLPAGVHVFRPRDGQTHARWYALANGFVSFAEVSL